MNQLFEKQGWHALALAVLLGLTAWMSGFKGVLAGELFGRPTTFWFWLAVSIPIAHQVFAVVVWRKQLHDRWMTRKFGEKGFTVYAVIFNIFLLSRPLSAILLSISNRESFSLDAVWRVAVSLALFIPFAYLIFSVLKYFGYKRAMGIDHFDERYHEMPLVQQGIFKYTDNAMYTFGFFILWIPPILAASLAGLLFAAFSHLYIWVHYLTTEKPDMVRMYDKPSP